MSKDNVGPAFPCEGGRTVMSGNAMHKTLPSDGMTLRDYFAIHATDEDIRSQQWKRIGRYSKACIMTRSQARYAHADAMPLERAK